MELIQELENIDQFSYATEVLLVRMKLDEAKGATIVLKDYETLAKYIYKDHSLPFAFVNSTYQPKCFAAFGRVQVFVAGKFLQGFFELKRRWQGMIFVDIFC